VENIATIVVLAALIGVYIYLLLSPTQPHVVKQRSFVVPEDSLAHFMSFVSPSTDKLDWGDDKWGKDTYKDTMGGGTIDGANAHDDFFLFQNGEQAAVGPVGPLVPSANFRCGEDWVSIRSQLNYKFLWMHTTNSWMNAGATADTPIHHKAFHTVPVNCTEGWVLLKEGDSNKYIYMVPPTETPDTWVVKMGTSETGTALGDQRYHFLLENEGYILNRKAGSFVNVMADSQYAVRGHSSSGGELKAGREYTANVQLEFLNASLVQSAILTEAQEEAEAVLQDAKYVQMINLIPPSAEKRVISFGLYGANPKYVVGAIHNVEAGRIYFPGWVCRFYVTNDVPLDAIDTLKQMGAEVEAIPPGMGYSSGMFWRFLVAADPTVDRYIVRDADSRLNARDRIAVEEWVESRYPVHILRDHVNHCLVMNGGMWGGVKGAISDMRGKVEGWTARDEYAADLNFLEQQVWPEIRDSQIAHDSYCCDRFPNARPFPSKRPITYQHVGQVFDAEDQPRLNDIDGFIRGVPVPGSCRKHADWIYG